MVWNISSKMLERLRQRAQQESCTIDELLDRLLADQPMPAASRPTLPPLFQNHDFVWTDDLYQFITENSSEAISVHAPDGRFLYINPAQAHLTGYSAEELIAFKPEELAALVHPDDLVHTQQTTHYGRLLAGETSTHLQYRMQLKDGSYIWIETASRPVFGPAGEITHIIATSRDITARKQAEDFRRYQAQLLQQVSDAIIATDSALKITSWNAAAQTIYGWTEDEVIGLPLDELLQTEWVEDLREQALDSLIRTGIWQGELRQKTRSGHTIYVLASVSWLRSDSGEIIGGVTVNRDITARKQAEEALQQSEARYKLLTEIMSDYALSVAVKPDGSLITEWVIGAFTEITGYPVSPPGAPASLATVHHDDYPRVHDDLMRTINNEPNVSEYRIFKYNSTEIVWLSVTRWPIWDDHEKRVVRFYSVAKDVTVRKQAEEALRYSEARLKSLLDSQTAFVIRTDMEGRFTYCNQPFLQKYGWFHNDLIGTSSLDTILEEDRDEALQAVEICIAQPGVPVQVVLRKPTYNHGILSTLWEFVGIQDHTGAVTEIQCVGFDISERIAAEQTLRDERQMFIAGPCVVFKWRIEPGWPVIYVSPNVTEQFGYLPSEFIEHGLLFDHIVHPDDLSRINTRIFEESAIGAVHIEQEYRLRHKNGEYRWVLESTTILRDSHGVVKSYQGYIQDITVQRNAREMAQEQLRLRISLEQEKDINNTIRLLISNWVHDLKTPLSVIGIARDVLARTLDQTDQGRSREKLETIRNQIQILDKLLNDLDTMSKLSFEHRELRLSRVNLAALCQITLQDMRETVGIHHRLVFVSDQQISFVEINEVLVNRILFNLLSNAVKYSPVGGEIRLELLRQGECIVLRVSDQGVGISEVDLPNIFKPFYRVNNTRSIDGSGLGLSIVQDCVQLHNGKISVESVVGMGTIFIVKLPLITSS